MPPKSEAQQGLFGMALAVKKGDTKLTDLPEKVRKKVATLAESISADTAKDFASGPVAQHRRSKGRPTRMRNARSA